MAKIETILVVGGGVAGLATAAALHRHGFRTELVERQQTWHALGAGFLVHGNGMRMLRSLGLAACVGRAGAVVRQWQFCDEPRNLLSETNLEVLWGDAGPCVGIERSKLQCALLPGVADLRCRLGTSVTSLEQNDHSVSVGFSDGSTGYYDLLVGADGIRSTVRALTLTTASPSDLGAMNWRSIAPIRSAYLPALQIHLGEACLFGLVPMGARRTYGFAYVVQPRFLDPLPGRLKRLRNRFATFGERVQGYLASLERDDQVICSAMEWMESEQWHRGRVVLVGDAAHASSPMTGQGGLHGHGGCMHAGRRIAHRDNRRERACQLRQSAQAPRQVGPAPEHDPSRHSYVAIGSPQCRAARARRRRDAGSLRSPRADPLNMINKAGNAMSQKTSNGRINRKGPATGCTHPATAGWTGRHRK